MSVDGWQTVLVLGGIRSGKSEFAESLVGAAGAVRYVATSAAAREDDPAWERRLASHRDRRPVAWSTEETGDDPVRLMELITAAKPEERSALLAKGISEALNNTAMGLGIAVTCIIAHAFLSSASKKQGLPFTIKAAKLTGRDTGESFAEFDRARGRFRSTRPTPTRTRTG